MIKAILFDVDGVLVDSEALSIEIGRRYFKSEGYEVKAEDFHPHLGTGSRDFFTGVAEDKGISNWSLDRAVEYLGKYYPEESRKADIAMKGAKRVLDDAKKAGIMIAACSSAPLWKVEANLAAIGVDTGFFDFVAHDRMVRRNKPEGDIYRFALASLGVDSEDAIVIEDSFGGIQSGKNAGVRTVGLTTTITEEKAAEAGADAVIQNLDSIPDFKTDKELEDFLFLPSDHDNRVRYGVNSIHPLERRLPENVILEKAIEKAIRARENAHAPYSHYKVGAAILSARTGRIYSGCNVENSSYGGTICAERNAITTAVAEEGKLGIDLLVVVSEDNPPAPPCALCLQVLAEFSRPETRVVLVDMDNNRFEYKFGDLLPHPFIMPELR